MVINDKLKGSYYRAPMTKLASRRNTINQINELNDYFNSLSEKLNKCFNKITTDRIDMKKDLLTIYEEILHFKYLLEHFHYEVDLHIDEKLNAIIDSFTTNIADYITKYDMNLFNHNTLTDDEINNQSESDTIEEWDRSVNVLSNSLGIRWFGGKIKDSDVLDKLSNILHITKINTYDGRVNEDYINSNLILELFIYTNKGMAWLVLGQNATFGYNMITKYISPDMNMNIKLASEIRNTQKEYNLNTVDMDMILTDIIGQNPTNDDVYIKVCTNIPANTESGKDGYYLTADPVFNSFEVKKNIINFGKGLMYRDNKDVGYYKREETSLLDIKSKNMPKIYTPNLLSPLIDKSNTFSTDNEIKSYYEEINFIKDGIGLDIQSKVFNPNGNEMNRITDKVNGIVIENSETTLNKGYLENEKMNEKAKDKPELFKGEQNVDLTDYKTTGNVSLMKENENMVKIENSDGRLTSVLENDNRYGDGNKDLTIFNNISNDKLKENIKDEITYEEITHLLSSKTNINENNGKTWKKANTTGLNFYCITIANDGRLIAGGRNSGFGSDVGIIYSDDNGETWNDSNITSGNCYCVTIANNGRLIASCGGKGIKYSDDNGETWNNSNITSDGYYCITLVNDNRLVACSSGIGIKYSDNNGETWYSTNDTSSTYYCIILANDGTLVAGRYNGIKYSDDNGITWNDTNITTGTYNCITLANDGTLVAYGNQGNGIKYSKDNGITWIDSNITSGRYNCITVANNGRLVAGSNNNIGIKYSDDNGITWNNSSITSGSYNYIIVDNDGTLVAGSYNDKGIKYSIDNGKTWNDTNITSGTYYCITLANNGTLVTSSNKGYVNNIEIKYKINYKKSGREWNNSSITRSGYNCITLSNNCRLVAGSNDNKGIKYSDDNGKTWTNSNINSGSYLCIILTNDGTLVASGGGRGIQYSNDNGITWNNSNIYYGYYKCITLANNGRLVAGSWDNGIKYSDDNGKTWNNSNITSGIYYCIILANNGTLVAGKLTNGGIQYSDDNGITWIDSNITSGGCKCITVTNNGRLVASSYSSGIKYSDDNGKTWNNSNDIRNGYDYIILANDGTLVAGSASDNGIKYSDDNGETWNNSNITNGYYSCITVANDGTLVASGYGYGNGIKYSDDNGETWNNSNITSGGYYCITVANDGTLVAGSSGNDGIKYSFNDIKYGIKNKNININPNKLQFIKNNRINYDKLYLLKEIKNISEFIELSIIQTEAYNFKSKLINNKLYIIPNNSEVKDIVYTDNHYFVLTTDNRIVKISNEFRIESIFHLNNIDSLFVSNNMLFIAAKDGKIYTDTVSLENHLGIKLNKDTKILVSMLNK